MMDLAVLHGGRASQEFSHDLVLKQCSESFMINKNVETLNRRFRAAVNAWTLANKPHTKVTVVDQWKLTYGKCGNPRTSPCADGIHWWPAAVVELANMFESMGW